MLKDYIEVIIDGIKIKTKKGFSILNTSRLIGGDIVPPAMCYYSSLPNSGGKCRTCLVEIVKWSNKNIDNSPKLVPSCNTEVLDGMIIKNTTSSKVLKARKWIVEMLLINHPLDCPICDQAGECELQNLSFKHGTEKTNYSFERRTFKEIYIGDKIKLHMNRCILCYRCVLVGDLLTNKRLHGVINRGNKAEISTYIKNNIDNDYSGNMIDVCPVGALTDKTFRFKSRVWYTKPIKARRNCKKCCGKVMLWYDGDNIIRVTARKNLYNEVINFICNDCRFHCKENKMWIIEDVDNISNKSVISTNLYKDDTSFIIDKNII
ncbi:MAG: (2Fe-2S)-binding protein [Bacteroides sp.]|nr:MAG: (2Fe-2S)-binding protein [Bacteroides sp.]